MGFCGIQISQKKQATEISVFGQKKNGIFGGNQIKQNHITCCVQSFISSSEAYTHC